jgi:hypothetical protein
MQDFDNERKTCLLVDAVFLERETSVVGATIDHLMDVIIHEPEISKEMILDLIALRWVASDILRGLGFTQEKIAEMDTNPRMEVRVGE